MLKSTLFVLLAFAMACAPRSASDNTEEANPVKKEQNVTSTAWDNFDWLLGNWQRLNEQDGRQTFEHWQVSKAGDYTGLGFTLENQDTVFKEILSIAKVEGTYNLIVEGVNEEPTHFKFSWQKEDGFVAENPQNEFPKKIAYNRVGRKLIAVVGDQNDKIAFEFVKLKRNQ